MTWGASNGSGMRRLAAGHRLFAKRKYFKLKACRSAQASGVHCRIIIFLTMRVSGVINEYR